MLDMLFRIIVDYAIVCMTIYVVIGINAATLPKEERISPFISFGISLMMGLPATFVVLLVTIVIGHYALPIVAATVFILLLVSCLYFRFEAKRERIRAEA